MDDKLMELARQAASATNQFTPDQKFIAKFAALVAAAERERCAKVCDENAEKWIDEQDVSDFRICAAAIRAMKD